VWTTTQATAAEISEAVLNLQGDWEMEDYTNDIPLDLAYSAHRGSSFVPDQRAKQERDGYAQTLAADFASLEQLCDTNEKREQLTAEFARYREGYKRRNLALLSSRSRCFSTMITGGSNFPVRQQEKRHNAAHRKLEECCEFRKRALNAIRKALCPGARDIMAGDADAVERLQAEIAEAEAKQSLMKATNAAIRKNLKNGRDAILAALHDVGHSAAIAAMLVEPGEEWGYPHYKLTNNNANIRRMKQRLVAVQAAKNAPDVSAEGREARIEDCPADNRVRLFFPDKPETATRDRLKAGGFRWTPSLGCWQAYRNPRAQSLARDVAGVA
jgi:hypothetical protein